MPVKKIRKRIKKPTTKGKKRVVATAPTRDVIININTARPRARREPTQKVIPKRNEDLAVKIRETELLQSQFRTTELIKEQARQIGLLDKRLSVLIDTIDNDRPPPLIQEGDTPLKPLKRSSEDDEDIVLQSQAEEPAPTPKKSVGRPRLSEAEKKARAESREQGRIEKLRYELSSLKGGVDY